MMNLDNYYLHATGKLWGNDNKNMNIISILNDGEIKGKKKERLGCHRLNEVCLIDPAIRVNSGNKYISAFYNFAIHSPCLVLNREFEVIKPELVNCPKINSGQTDMFDEVRYNGDLSLEKLEFITFPIWDANKISIGQLLVKGDSYIKNLTIFRETVNLIRNEYSYDIKDIFTGTAITSDIIDESIEKIKCKQQWKGYI